MVLKKCLVPICTNNSERNPKKMFIMVPSNSIIRKKWFDAIFNKEIRIPKTKYLYVCEDHFNLQNDAENFDCYKTIGKYLQMKKDAIPTKNLNEMAQMPPSQFSSSSKKRKLVNIEAYESRKKLIFGQEMPPTSTGSPTRNLDMTMTVSSPSGSFSIDPLNPITDKKKGKSITLLTRRKFLKTVKSQDSSSSSSSGLSIVPLSGSSSSDTIKNELLKDHMKKLNVKVTIYNVEHNSRLFLGLPQEEYFLIKMTEDKCRINYQNIMITLKKIRCNDSYARLAILFGVSDTMIGKIFLSALPVIAGEYQNLIFFPDDMNTLLCIPSQFLPTYKHVRSIIDCFEIEIETPSNSVLQAITWSQYKHTNTVKYLISSTPNGFINYISQGFGGRTSDREIIETSGYLKEIPRNCTVLADRGFKNVEHLLHRNNCTLVRPPSVSTNTKMSKAEVMESRRIAACRIHIERVIRRIREFNMLEPHAIVNSNLVPWTDTIVIIACAIINTQGSLIK